MSAGPDPRTVNPQQPQNIDPVELERRRLSQRLDEVARMCESGMPAMTFYQEMLTRLLESLAAIGGSVYIKTSQGNLQQQFAINLQQIGVDASEESRRAHHGLLQYAFTSGEQMSVPPGAMGKAENGQPAPGNPTQCLLLIVPIRNNEGVLGLIEVFQGPNRPAKAVPGFMQYMSLMADLAARYQRNQLVGQLVGQQQLWTQLESFARILHGSLNTTEVAFNIANEGRRLIECDRVSVAVRRGGEKCRVEAVSGTDVVEHRSNMVRLMRKLCDAVLDWGERLTYTGTKDDALPPKVLDAMDQYLEESPSKMLVVMPLRDEREGDGKDKPKQPPRSVLVVESFETPAEPEQVNARLEVVAKHATTALYNAIEYRRIPMRWLWMPLAKMQEGLGGKTKAIVLLIVLGVSLLGASLYAFPYPLKMESTGKCVPVIRRTVYTSAPGVVERFVVEPNAEVSEGQLLAIMHDAELARKMITLKAEMQASETEANFYESQVEKLTTEADKREARTKAITGRFTYETKRQEINELVRRTNARRDAPGYFALLAPSLSIEEKRRIRVPSESRWTILTSNFKTEMEKREVRPNEPVMRIGVKGGPWEVELKIPQKHIGQVLRAYERQADKSAPLDVDFLLLTDTTRIYKGKLHPDRIAGEASPNTEDPNDPEPYVLAYVDVEDPTIPEDYRIPRDQLVAGAEVRAKVRCGSARAGYSLFYGVWEFLYEKVVFYLF